MKIQKEISYIHKSIHWIFNERNGGFAYAMNQGLAQAKGGVLVIMNPDVQVISGMDKMLSYLNANNNIGAIAPQIINNKNIIQDSGRTCITLISFIRRHIKRVVFHSKILYDTKFNPIEIQPVDWVIGAFIMVKREVYELTSGLDDRYFLYCEDMDWCTRIRKCGYDIIYYPLAQIKYEGTRSARKSIRYSLIFLKSLFRYWSKFGFFKIKLT